MAFESRFGYFGFYHALFNLFFIGCINLIDDLRNITFEISANRSYFDWTYTGLASYLLTRINRLTWYIWTIQIIWNRCLRTHMHWIYQYTKELCSLTFTVWFFPSKSLVLLISILTFSLNLFIVLYSSSRLHFFFIYFHLSLRSFLHYDSFRNVFRLHFLRILFLIIFHLTNLLP